MMNVLVLIAFGVMAQSAGGAEITNIRAIHDSSEYRKQILIKHSPHLLFFWARWSQQSNLMVPEWEKACAALHHVMPCVSVASTVGDPDMFKALGVKEYPSILYLHPMGRVYPDSSVRKTHVLYRGRRTAKDIVTWATSPNALSTRHIHLVNNEANETVFLTEDPNLPKVLLFSAKDSSPVVYTAMSYTYRYRAVFGFVTSSSTAMLQKYKVVAVPTLLVVGDRAYNGKMTDPAEISRFLDDRVLDERLIVDTWRVTYFREELARVQEENLTSPVLFPIVVVTKKDLANKCIKLHGEHCMLVFAPAMSAEHNRLQSVLQSFASQLPKWSRVAVVPNVVDSVKNKAMTDFFNCTAIPCVVFLFPKRSLSNVYPTEEPLEATSLLHFVVHKLLMIERSSYNESFIPPFVRP